MTLRFKDKTTNSFAFDWVVYSTSLGNGPSPKEVMGYQTKDPVVIQDNWAYSVNTKSIARFNNLPSYLLVNPTDYTSGAVTVTMRIGDDVQ